MYISVYTIYIYSMHHITVCRELHYFSGPSNINSNTIDKPLLSIACVITGQAPTFISRRGPSKAEVLALVYFDPWLISQHQAAAVVAQWIVADVEVEGAVCDVFSGLGHNLSGRHV